MGEVYGDCLGPDWGTSRGSGVCVGLFRRGSVGSDWGGPVEKLGAAVLGPDREGRETSA